MKGSAYATAHYWQPYLCSSQSQALCDDYLVFGVQVLFLDARKGTQLDRLLQFANLVREHMQQAGDLQLHFASMTVMHCSQSAK